MKKITGFVAVLAALLMTAFFVGCNNAPSDPLSGNSYKPTRMESEGTVVTSNGSTISITTSGSTVTITRSGSTYTATCEGVDVTSTLGQTYLETMYDEMSPMFAMSISFNNGVISATIPGEGTQTGTYTVNGNAAIVTTDGESGTITTSDNWQTFVMTEDGMTMTFTRQ